MENEKEEEHTKDGTNNKLVNPAVDDGGRRDGGCGCRCTTAAAAVATAALRSGYMVFANLVQAYCGADVGSTKPTNVELWCMPHHSWTPPSSSLSSSLTMSSYPMIRYSIHEAKYSKYDYFACIRRKSIVKKNYTQ